MMMGGLELLRSQTFLPFADERRNQAGRGAPRRKSELFFALKPGLSVARAIYEAAEEHGRNRTNRKPHPPELLHLSLLSMGEYEQPPYELVPRIDAAIGSVWAKPIGIKLDGSAIYGNGQHLALTSTDGRDEIRALVRLLYFALDRNNLERTVPGSISPHVTVIYGYGKGEPLAVMKPYVWLAREFVLVYSHRGEGRHEHFGCWRLDPDAPAYRRQPEQLRLFS